jgi:hypothetical protein
MAVGGDFCLVAKKESLVYCEQLIIDTIFDLFRLMPSVASND